MGSGAREGRTGLGGARGDNRAGRQGDRGAGRAALGWLRRAGDERGQRGRVRGRCEAPPSDLATAAGDRACVCWGRRVRVCVVAFVRARKYGTLFYMVGERKSEKE